MASPPFITPGSWWDIGGSPLTISGPKKSTWAQTRVAVSSLNETAPISFFSSVGPSSIFYQYAPDTTGRIFRGVPLGVACTFYTEPEPAPSTDVKWYFFWGGYYESPPDSGIYVQGIGAGLDANEIGTILDGATIVCQNTSFVAGSAARDASGVGQYVASYPAGTGPGSINSITTVI